MRRCKLLTRLAKRLCQLNAGLWLWCYSQSVFAAGNNDFSLEHLNSAIEGHLSGDFGKLMGLASIGWLIIGSVAGFNVRLLVSVFVLLLAISFGPGLISSVVGG